MEKVASKYPTRLIWLDQLKAISMYIVVLGHSLLKFKEHLLFKFIYSFHMPLFFMISGFTFHPEKYKRVTDCIKDKCIRLAYPYFVLNILVLPFWFINVKTGMIADDPIPKLLFGILYSNSAVARAPSNATWFIMTLLLAEILYFIQYHYLKDDKSVFLMSCILCVIGVMSPLGKEVADAPFHLDVSLVAQFYYGCGYLLRKNFGYIKDCFFKYTNLKVVFLILAGLFFSIINKQVDFSNELYRNFVYTLISSISISVVLFYIISKLKFSIKLFSYIGKNTIIILVFHIPILRILQAAFPFFMERQLNAIFASVIVYLLMIPLIWFINKFFGFAVKMPLKLKEMIEKI